jgi:hypothetical protein
MCVQTVAYTTVAHMADSKPCVIAAINAHMAEQNRKHYLLLCILSGKGLGDYLESA